MDCRPKTFRSHSLQTRSLPVLLAGVVLAWPIQLTAAAPDLFEMSLEELGNITITGSTLTEKKLTDVPAAVTVFTREEIRRLPVGTVEQLMNYVPGFQSTRSSDTGMSQPYSVRGRKFGVSGREVLVTINGMRIENFFTGGAASTYPMIPLANVARIEFIRGPGSSLYGSNALTGMINIITEEQDSRLNLSGGSQDLASANWLQQLDGDALNGSLFVQGFRDNGDQYQVQDTFSPQQVSTRDPHTGGDALLQMTFNNTTRVQLLAAERNADDFYVTGFIANGFNHYSTDYYHGMLEQTLRWSDVITSKLQTGYSRYVVGVDTQAGAAGALAAISTPSSSEALKFLSETVATEAWVRWLNDWNMGHDQTLQFGMSYRRPELEHATINSNFDLAALSRSEFPLAYRDDFSNRSAAASPVDMEIAAAFVQYQTALGDIADLVLGARYDSYSQIGAHISPRVALTLHPTAHDSFKLLYGRAFDAPVAAELYTINNPILLGNPDLGPETVDTGEVIWLHQWQRATFTTSYFYNRFHDSISQAVVNGVRTYENASHDTSEGMEMELNAQLHDQFSLRATATGLFRRVESSFRESDTLFSVIARYQQPYGYASLASHHQSDKQTLSNNGSRRETLDGFTLANLKLGYYAGKNLETYLELLNLADVVYFTPSVSGNIAAGIPNRRRELRLGFVWDY